MGNGDLGTTSINGEEGLKPGLRVARMEHSRAGREKWRRRKLRKEKMLHVPGASHLRLLTKSGKEWNKGLGGILVKLV